MTKAEIIDGKAFAAECRQADIVVAAAITPVPGEVGPMTIACLLANTVTAAERQMARG